MVRLETLAKRGSLPQKGCGRMSRRKQSGQAIVTLPDGRGGRRDVLLGKYDSRESWAQYDRVIAEWRSNGRSLPVPEAARADLTLNELMVAYWRHVEAYYVKDGKPTSEQATIRHVLRFVKQLYGGTPARDFGPRCLKAVREAMVHHPITRTVKVKDAATGEVKEVVRTLRQGLARRFINKQVSRIKRMFAWAVGEELVPVTVHQTLLRVEGLKKGKGEAREKPRVKPVADDLVEKVLPLVPGAVRAMIEVQRLCGGRPQDIVGMRAIDIDTTGAVWEYHPPRYKTEHHNDGDVPERERVVYLGPKAQAILKPFLTVSATDYLFSPIRSEQARSAQRRQGRSTPLWPSHVRHQALKRKRRSAPLRDHYDMASYRRAIRRACLKAGIPIWYPLQLRHSRGTEIRKRYGLEASQAVLGHSELGVTQVYAEVDQETARRVMAEIG
jgi:integrase